MRVRASVVCMLFAVLVPTVAGCSFKPLSIEAPKDTSIGVVVYDNKQSRYLVSQGKDAPFMAASLTKILLAISFYVKNASPTQDQKDTIDRMLSLSDDGIASDVYREGGGKSMIQFAIDEIGLRNTTPPPAGHNGWGATVTTASDMASVYQYLLQADSQVGEPILTALGRFVECAADGLNQKYGLFNFAEDPSYPVTAAKQGWYAFANTPATGSCKGNVGSEPHATYSGNTATVGGVDWSREFLHTTGIVGSGNRYIVVILTSSPANTTFAEADANLTSVLDIALTNGIER